MFSNEVHEVISKSIEWAGLDVEGLEFSYVHGNIDIVFYMPLSDKNLEIYVAYEGGDRWSICEILNRNEVDVWKSEFEIISVHRSLVSMVDRVLEYYYIATGVGSTEWNHEFKIGNPYSDSMVD